MKICTNCKIQLSCGCQRRDASDGMSCCDQCIHTYEAKIAIPIPPQPIHPPIQNKMVDSKDIVKKN